MILCVSREAVNYCCLWMWKLRYRPRLLKRLHRDFASVFCSWMKNTTPDVRFDQNWLYAFSSYIRNVFARGSEYAEEKQTCRLLLMLSDRCFLKTQSHQMTINDDIWHKRDEWSIEECVRICRAFNDFIFAALSGKVCDLKAKRRPEFNLWTWADIRRFISVDVFKWPYKFRHF